jgi:hypothetical protein
LLVQVTRSHSSCCRNGGPKPAGSGNSGACLLGASVQKPQELLQSQNRACGQWEPWGLLAGAGFQEYSTAAAAGTGNQASWLVPSVTSGAMGALVLLIQGSQFPWHFRVKVAGFVVEGSMEP